MEPCDVLSEPDSAVAYKALARRLHDVMAIDPNKHPLHAPLLWPVRRAGWASGPWHRMRRAAQANSLKVSVPATACR
jgi:hypothetical protein